VVGCEHPIVLSILSNRLSIRTGEVADFSLGFLAGIQVKRSILSSYGLTYGHSLVDPQPVVPIPVFSEANHPLIKSLAQQSDQELIGLFQRYPETGQYFVALFCRYTPMLYPVVQRTAQSPVRADYLFALVWRHLFNELSALDLAKLQAGTNFQAWLLNKTAAQMNQIDLPALEDIHYDMKAASPPFWCYLDRALDEMPPDMRLIVVMAQTFNWSETRIAAYLQAEGETLSPAGVKQRLEQGYELLEKHLPEDIRLIYLAGNAKH
jgi:DNA-directed RNA polymerase specialized sigma24 family protein